MKRIHILLMGSLMLLTTPALADDQPQLGYNNDNPQPSAAAPNAPIGGHTSYADYVANDDDHGDDSGEVVRVSAPDNDNNEPRDQR